MCSCLLQVFSKMQELFPQGPPDQNAGMPNAGMPNAGMPNAGMPNASQQ